MIQRLLSIIISWALLGSSILPTQVQAQSSPPEPASVQITADTPLSVNDNKQQQGQSFSLKPNQLSQQSFVNAFTGAANLSLPLQLPSGIRGFSPNLSLNYSSQASNSNGLTGFGWSLSQASIRRINKNGVDQMYDHPIYYASVGPVQGELILLTSTATEESYGLRREQAFARIIFHKNSNSWTITTTDGTHYTLGNDDQSRDRNDDQSLTYAWHLSQQQNPQGLTIQHRYRRINQVLYPKSISYGASVGNSQHPFEIRFEPFYSSSNPLPNRIDPHVDYRRGFRATNAHLLEEVQIWVSGQHRLSYDLEYLSNAFRSDLKSFTLRSIDEPDLSQQIRFQYFSARDGYLGPLYHRSRLLKSIHFHQGGEISFDYEPSNQLHVGNQYNERPHFPVMVVTKLTRSDGLGQSARSNYFYEHSSYFYESELERDVAGFGKVTITDPLNQQTIQYFHQGGGFDGRTLGENTDSWELMGKTYRLERYNAQQQLVLRKITHWGQDQQFTFPESIITSHVNGAGEEQSSAVTFQYDPSTGNLLERHELGQVTASNDGSWNDFDEDDRKVVTEYASNTEHHLLAYPSRQLLFDHQDQLIAEQQSHYDQLPLGQITRGLLTESRQHLLEENRFISQTYEYNSNGQLTRVIDPHGHELLISYDNLSLYPISSTNALGHTSHSHYDPLFGKLISSTDPNGLESRIILDGLGRVIERQLSDPNDNNQLVTMSTSEYRESSIPHSTITTTWLDDQRQISNYQYLDGFGRSIQTRRQHAYGDFIVSNTSYDLLGRVSTQTLPTLASGTAWNPNQASSINTQIEYDALNRKTLIQDTNGSTTISYDRWQHSITDALGNSKTFIKDAYGRLSTLIEGNNFQTSYHYDSRDLPIQITNANGNIRHFSYDSLGRLIVQEDLHNPNDTDFGSRSFTYDDNSNILRRSDAKGQVLEYQYDALNRLLSEELQGDSSTRVNYTYDQGDNAIGRVSSINSAKHNWTPNYDRRGRLITESLSMDGQVFTKQYHYTRFDQPQSIETPDGLMQNYEYNSIGQLNKIFTQDGNIIDGLAYSPLGQIEEVFYGNGLLSLFEYDPQQMYRLVRKQTLPSGQQTTFRNDTSWWSFLFPNAQAQILEDDMPQIFDDSNDPILEQLEKQKQSRGTNRKGPRASRRKSQLRDGTGGWIQKPLITFNGDSQGDNSALKDLLYIQASYQNTMTEASAATHYRLRMESDTSQLIEESQPIELSTPLQHDESTELLSLDLTTLQLQPETTYRWQLSFQLEDGNQSPWSDQQNFTTAATTLTAPETSTLQDLFYEYDAVGNIRALRDVSGTAATRNVHYDYDNLYRLTNTTTTQTTAGQDYSRNQSYGPTGNILSKSDQEAYHYDQNGSTNPQAVTSIDDESGNSRNFSYDANGNLTQELITTAAGTISKDLSWDHKDRLSSVTITNEVGFVTTVSFTYDHNNRRLSKTVSDQYGSETTLYPFEDYQISPKGKTKVSIAANAMHLATVENDQGTRRTIFSHTDHLGGGNILSDQDGNQVQTLDYYPFGELRVDEQYDHFDESKKYTGHEFDENTGLYYAQARYYHPAIGRFISQDPLSWRAEEQFQRFADLPQAFNQYSYAINNPVILIDPEGEFFWFAAAALLSAAPAISTALFVATSTAAGQMSAIQTVEDAASTIEVIQSEEPIQSKALQSGLFIATNNPISSKAKPLKKASSPVKKFVNEVAQKSSKVIKRGPRGNLRKNLEKLYGKTSNVVEAHHIVAYNNEKAAPARAALDKFGIDINAIDNGAFLPARGAKSSMSVVHDEYLHSDAYFDMVNRRLSEATSRKEARDTLNGIRDQLLTNSIDYK